MSTYTTFHPEWRISKARRRSSPTCAPPARTSSPRSGAQTTTKSSWRTRLLGLPDPQLLRREAARAGHRLWQDHADGRGARRPNHVAGGLCGRRAAGDGEQGRQGEGVRRDDAGGADGVRDGPRAEQRGAVADSGAFGGGGRRGGARCDHDALGEDGGRGGESGER